ncbi:hypothetical protein VTK56DRAFT_7057 [Thermocarpiscus australiensis]
MKATITAALSLLATLSLTVPVSAKCYGSGEEWGARDVVLNAARDTCKSQLSGSFGPSGGTADRKAACINGNGKKLEFQIFHLQEGERNLSPNDCFNGLQEEIVGCDRGGDSSKTDFRFKADPNAGSC